MIDINTFNRKSEIKISKKLLLGYAGLPAICEKITYMSLGYVPTVSAKFTRILNNMPESSKLFVTGGWGCLVNDLLDSNKKVQGVDYSLYFTQHLNNETVELNPAPFTFVYNVDAEAAVKKEFSSKLLMGLILKITQTGARAILCSDLCYTDFNRLYGIDFKNRVALKDFGEEVFV